MCLFRSLASTSFHLRQPVTGLSPTVTAPINPYPNGPESQAAYYWVFPVIHIAGAAANEAQYVTLMGLWPCQPSDIGSNTPVYDYPRDVKVILSSPVSQPAVQHLDQLHQRLRRHHRRGRPNATVCELQLQPHRSLYERGRSSFDLHRERYWVSSGVRFQPERDSMVSDWSSAWTVTVPPPTIPPQGWFSNWYPPPYPPSPPPGDAWHAPQRLWRLVSTVEVLVAPPNDWMDSTGWFVMDPNYFTVGTAVYQGGWFPAATQPPQNGNLLPFVVAPNQPFNFSVYADYLSVQDPSNATMQIGFRWYYADGTWTEHYPNGSPTYATYSLTDTLTRYSAPPPDPSQFWMANPPPEAVTQAQSQSRCFR